MEYDDVEGDVVVRAIAPGIVVTAGIISGYGGTVAIRHEIEGSSIFTVYGHLAPNSLPNVGAEITAGQPIGLLGKGGTDETDGERKHLHLGMLKQNIESLSGYVGNENELEGWYDPMEFFK